MRTVTGQDDFACMAETVRRRYTRLVSELKAAAAKPQQPAPTAGPAGEKSVLPGLILIDGGKGQLNAACAELAKLGLSQIPVIGLAKEFEEIYRPGQKEPLRLSHDSAALKLAPTGPG
jgi:excinuclease ABC subunit C